MTGTGRKGSRNAQRGQQKSRKWKRHKLRRDRARAAQGAAK